MTRQKKSPENFTKIHQSLLPMEEMLELKKRHRQLSIGIPAEGDKNEGRIAITPMAVEQLVYSGHKVIIETNAGNDSNFNDIDYSECGAQIVDSREEVFKTDIILKISPFAPDELQMLRENQLVISALNIGTQTEAYIRNLMAKKVTAVAFELITDENNCLPVVRSMSEISGSTSILIAADYLSNKNMGMGKVLGGITGVNPSEVVILGAGTAGEFAARTALALGAIVKVFDSSIFRLKNLQQTVSPHVYTSILQSNILSNSLRTADVAIGAMNQMQSNNKFIVTNEMVRDMKKGAVIVDISIDQGGCFETSEITSHEKPVFVKHDVVHYCVPNIASRVARTASYALSNIFAPILSAIGDSGGISKLIRDDEGLRKGVYIYNGILTNRFIGEHFGIQARDIDLLSAAF